MALYKFSFNHVTRHENTKINELLNSKVFLFNLFLSKLECSKEMVL